MLAVSGAALIVIGRGATLGGSLIRLVKRFERKYSILRPLTGGIPPRLSRRSPLGICISSCGIISARRWSDSRSEEHTSDLQSLMRISYAVLCLKKNRNKHIKNTAKQ